MSNDLKNQYTFVAANEDVDFNRIIAEAPKDTKFILVEERTRTRQAKVWSLFVHSSILNDPRVQGITLGDESDCHDNVLGPEWGHSSLDDTAVLQNYRFIAHEGAVPGYVKKGIDYIKRDLNPKDTKVFVSLY